jgi:alanyl-tRNA synthetase
MTAFVMAGQHAFNDGSGKGYWKERCIELNFEFLSKIMGIPGEEITYVEDLWAMNDMSAFGPSMESFSKGLEIVNSVFMQFQGVSGGTYRELPLKVIDVGWGFDRLSWFTQGTPTVYDSSFGPVADKFKKDMSLEYDLDLFRRYAVIAKNLDIDCEPDLKRSRSDTAKRLGISVDELEKKIGPMEAAYAVLDHSRALAFAISDGGMPSNVGGGYNLRVIARRAMSFIEKHGWNVRLDDIALQHADYLRKMFPELSESEEEIKKVLSVEEKKFRQNRDRSKKIATSFAGRKPSMEELVRLYDSDGITPEQLGVDVPAEFYDEVTKRHVSREKDERKPKLDVSGIPPTQILYYEEPYIFEFGAKILKIFGDNHDLIVLDRTAFYPTSGGQMHDTGTINGVKVIDVFKVGKIIVHRLASPLEKSEDASCSVDRARRERLMRHHDAVHILNGAARAVLGSHVNQAGSEKDEDKARLDITHYESLTEGEIEEIERLANEVAKKGVKILKEEMARGEAEQKYGFRIYQGGYVPSKNIRVVEVKDFDIEACGGTHGHDTSEAYPIKIIGTKKIADGMVRIEIVAGEAALEYMREKARILGEVAKKLGVGEEEVPVAVRKLFDEWKKARKGKK